MENFQGIILAAGLSQRTGSHKMLMRFGEMTILEKCVDSMSSVCSSIIVVGGYHFDDIVDVLNGWQNVELVYNSEYLQGMYSSVKTGIRHVKTDRFFITPGDYPLIDDHVYKEMADIHEEIVVPAYRGSKGHPLLMCRAIAEELLENNYFCNLREFVNYKGYYTIEVDDPGILRDVDTLDDYMQLLTQFEDNRRMDSRL